MNRIIVFNKLTHFDNELVDNSIFDTLLKSHYNHFNVFFMLLKRMNRYGFNISKANIKRCNIKDGNLYFIITHPDSSIINDFIESIGFVKIEHVNHIYHLVVESSDDIVTLLIKEEQIT